MPIGIHLWTRAISATLARGTVWLATVIVANAFDGGAGAWAIQVPEAPFAPEQCGRAADHARVRLAANPTDGRASRILAEALLCSGALGDVRALDQAVHRLRSIVGAAPDDVFAHLYFADALRRRHFLSDEALDAARTARAVLRNTDVGAARPWLERRLDGWIARLETQRIQFAQLLGDGEARFRDGTATPLEVGDWLLLLATTGPQAARRAEGILAESTARGGDAVLSSYYRAELLQADLPDEELVRLYEQARGLLCGDPTDTKRTQRCATAERRLRRLYSDDDPDAFE